MNTNLIHLFSKIRIRLGYLKRWLKILLGGNAARDRVLVSYGYSYIPLPDENATGGIIKFQRLQEHYQNSPNRFNILYLGSGTLPKDWSKLFWVARRKKAQIVCNQNGVAYSAWHGPGWEKTNKPMIKVLREADYVFYQSRFCKLAADRFLGKRDGPWEILYNAVDTTFFTPSQTYTSPRNLVLLLAGNQYLDYPVQSALQALAIVARQRNDVRLLVTGRLKWLANEDRARKQIHDLMDALGIEGKVEFLGPHTQNEAPAVYRKAHILLHTKYNDPCPSAVIEAMACGLPVVYSHSGGVPELAGSEAGIGVPAKLSWEKVFPPDPNKLAEAVLEIAEQRQSYADAARQRAIEHFDLQAWKKRHVDVFGELLSNG